MIPTASLPMDATEVKAWWSRIELARARRKRESDKWKKLLQGYLPPTSDRADDINSNIHFRNVETKKANLFFQLPELQLEPLPPLQALIDPATQQPIDPYKAVAAKRELLNKLLGRDHANVLRTIDALLFDILAVSGVGASMIAYHCDYATVEDHQPGPAAPNVGDILGINPIQTQVTQPVPVSVHEAWLWEPFSAAALLIPHDWMSTLYDAAPWLGREFCYPLKRAIREFGLPADFRANTSTNDLTLSADDKVPGKGSAEFVKGVLIWLHASEFDETEPNSQVFRELVLIEGQDDVTRYRPSPYQDKDEYGRLTTESMIGNPIHPLVVRDCSDSAWIQSDSAFTDPLVRQENTWAAQDIQRRDANIPRFLYDEAIKEAIDKLRDLTTGQGAGVDGQKLLQGMDKLIAMLPHLEQSQSDVEGRAQLRRAIDETLAVSSNQAGALNSTVRSATEVAAVQQNISVRLRKERARVMEWFLSGLRKFDAVVTQYGDLDTLTPLVGQANAQTLLLWKSVNGRNAFDAKTDSQLSADAAEDRKSFLDFQNFNAKNPFVDQLQLSRIGAAKHGYDASTLIRQPQPPPPPAPDPKISISFTAADLDVPEARMLLGLPQNVSPEAAMHAANLRAQAAKSPKHGGTADTVDPLSKHHGELTGGMPGRVPDGAPPQQVSGMVQ